MIDLNKIKARLDASPDCTLTHSAQNHTISIGDHEEGYIIARLIPGCLGQSQVVAWALGNVFANAPADLRALVAEVERLRSENTDLREALREMVEAVDDMCHLHGIAGGSVDRVYQIMSRAEPARLRSQLHK